MLHSTIESVYSKPYSLFKRLVSLAFTLAGCYWIFIYALQFAGMLDAGHLVELRSGQTLPYFILLSVWGVEYLRTSRRLATVIKIANDKNIPPNQVSADLLGGRMKQFSVIPLISTPVAIPAVFNTVGLLVSYGLIARQYVKLLQLL
ncbi:MAG: hypothetical protein D8M52_09760 [Chlorobi bacterium]|nr:MAG: hypothetical protein F9K28_08980 [Bacteroidota bacterium]KXK32593.1 MAG: hypothetical protein UZ06_CHB003002025 [Chlorobi bacterium OLB6]MBE2265506.1 hypothetical protein [Flavobacteriales bacterium]MBL1161986.1 hypothetical protein [Chlorobiota bacterium]MBW7854443.1 hypothetical protein [Candidatus Kapabacteria bacterium]MCC6331713.1 hypothetical protein [Ignavibacteria bacterium]